ncbi:hypothetical protein A4G18_04530 [Pasteurellaceae bacterium Pebbles2]|nr:hypothetical protein [Pasteurellaceae bacterium Pebbles2]
MTEPLFQHHKQQEHCPKCGSPLQMRHGKKGLFLGCTAFPQCDYLKPLHAHSETKILKELDETCPECAQPLQVKQGSFGLFIGCSGYPDCHFIVHEESPTSDDHFPCPECHQGELVARTGRQGKTFYGCNQFPRCKFTLASQPYAVTCPHCAGTLATLKKSSKTHRTFLCANRHCKQLFELE